MIVEVLRTYSGAEGHRVKPGTRFAIAGSENAGGLQIITRERFLAMSQRPIPLMREFNPAAAPAAPAAEPKPKGKPGPKPKAKVVPDSAPPPMSSASLRNGPAAAREATIAKHAGERTRTRDKEPGRPRPLARGAKAAEQPKEVEPTLPTASSVQNGSPLGAEAPASSSQEGRAPRAPRSGPRGTRKSAGSPSTTPGG